MTRQERKALRALLTDVVSVLKEFGACDDSDCKTTPCLRVLPRTRAMLAKLGGTP